MIEDLLPPSPNWYCSQASDSNGQGLFAYATRNVVFLLDVRKNQPCLAGCLAGHSSRVTAVKFSHVGGGGGSNHGSYLCVTAGDDGCVKLWDVRNKSVVNEHRLHNENKVTAVDWCFVTASSTSLIVTGDERGCLICWNHVSGESKELLPERRPVYCLASCPHDGAYVAVGYKTGLVLIVDIINKGQIIHKLRGHDEEIQSVCWSPALGEKISPQPQVGDEDKTSNGGVAAETAASDLVKVAPVTSTTSPFKDRGCLLISGSRDRTIRVWNTTQGKAVMTLNLPPRAGFHRTRERGDDGGKTRVWLALSWPSDQPRRFISSSHGGDIIRWDLCIPGKQKWEYLGNDDSISHSRIVFNITNTFPFSDDMFITTSMDRQIICWSAKTRKAIWTLPTLGGFVYSLSACPVDPRCLALGVGDNMIRVWNMTSQGKDNTVSVLWQGIKSKVTALSWHPERDNCLAYGTDDGRVGIYNTFTQGKGPHLSSTFHKKTVYSLNWGPQCPFKEGGMSYCLYSCGGDGAIYQHNPSKLGEDATNFNSLIRSANQITYMLPLRTDVSWRDDWKAVAIGNEDGSIEVFAAPSLLLLCTIQVHHKLINCLQWYPGSGQSEASVQLSDQSAGVLQDGSDGSGQSGRRYWLASGSNEPQVQVHDLASVLGGTEPVQLKAPITGAFRTLNGHTLRITALSWSPHGNGYLVSASYDGTAQVWDVTNGQPVANFRGHLGRLFSVVWSGLDPDVVFTGGEDFCLLKWRVSNVQHTKPPAHKRNTAPLQRGGKKSTSSAKSNKKRSKPPRDTTISVSDIPPESAAPEVPISKSSDHQDLAASTGPVEDTLPDMSELQKLLEEKRLEMMKDAVAKEDLAIDDKVGRATNDALDTDKIVTEPDDVTADTRGEGRVEERATDVGDVSETRATDAADATFRKEGRRKKKHRSLFPLSRGQDNRGKLYHLQDCITVAQHKYGSEAAEQPAKPRLGEGDGVHLGLFADRRAAYAMFREEGGHHDEVGYHDQSQQLEMWKGNLAGVLSKATESNQLSSFLVAMAPLGGYDVWLETTEAYAKQLERNQDYVQASTYYLACHKIHKAISLLVDNKLFREAVALASVRLSRLDPAFSDVYIAWASHLEAEGNYAQAAKCYLTVNQPADAVMLLGRKSDIPTLAAALRISCVTDQGNLTNGLMVRYLHECLMAADWSETQSLLTNHRSVLSGSLVAILHELTVMTLIKQKLISEDLFQGTRPSPWIQDVLAANTTQIMDEISEWTSLRADQSPLLSHAVDQWFVQCGMNPEENNDVQCLYNEVTSIRQQPSQHISEKQLLIALAFEMTLGQLSLMMGGASAAVSHWLNAVAMRHDVADMNTAKGVLSLVLPEGEETFKKLQRYPTSPSSSADVTSLRAYYLSTVLYHLWWEVGNVLLLERAVLDKDSSVSGRHGTERDGMSAVQETSHPSMHSKNGMEKTLSELEPAQDGAAPPVMIDDQDAACASGEVGREVSGVLDKRSFLEKTLCKKLAEISKTLLSEPYAKLRCLKGRLQYIQTAAANMVARHAREGQRKEASTMDASSKGCASEKNGSSDAKPDKSAATLQELSVPLTASHPNKDDANNLEESSLASPVFSSTTERLELAPTSIVDLTSSDKVDLTSAKEIDLASTDGLSLTSTKELDSTSTEQLNLASVKTAPKVTLNNSNAHCSQPVNGSPDEVQGITDDRPYTDLNDTAPEVSVLDQEEVASSEARLPSDWDSLMADVKYSHPAVTYAVLMEEQGRLLQELQKLGQDSEVHNPFPDTVESALVIFHICRSASQKMNVSEADRSGLRQLMEKATSWCLQYSWLTCQREAIW